MGTSEMVYLVLGRGRAMGGCKKMGVGGGWVAVLALSHHQLAALGAYG